MSGSEWFTTGFTVPVYWAVFVFDPVVGLWWLVVRVRWVDVPLAIKSGVCFAVGCFLL